jgi:hypothetical protein
MPLYHFMFAVLCIEPVLFLICVIFLFSIIKWHLKMEMLTIFTLIVPLFTLNQNFHIKQYTFKDSHVHWPVALQGHCPIYTIINSIGDIQLLHLIPLKRIKVSIVYVNKDSFSSPNSMFQTILSNPKEFKGLV